jgi:hypothetical protein
MQEATQKTADQLIARMTEVEKCIVRGATNNDRLEYLRLAHFHSDRISEADMLEVKAKLDAAYVEAGKSTVFGLTWKF